MIFLRLGQRQNHQVRLAHKESIYAFHGLIHLFTSLCCKCTRDYSFSEMSRVQVYMHSDVLCTCTAFGRIVPATLRPQPDQTASLTWFNDNRWKHFTLVRDFIVFRALRHSISCHTTGNEINCCPFHWMNIILLCFNVIHTHVYL